MKTSSDDIGRIYHTPSGRYYSVTTMLSNTKDTSGLDAWRKRVGEDEANHISKYASITGTSFHLLCEDELLNRIKKRNVDPIAKKLFRQVSPIIKSHISKTIYSELSLYSDTLKLAGTCDGIVLWDNVLSLIDFKSCKYVPNNKDHPFIQDYWIQSEIYRFMAKERLNIQCKQSVLIFSAKANTASKFLVLKNKDSKPVAEKAISRIKSFRKKLEENNVIS